MTNFTENILVFRFGQLGDTLVAIPAFWKIRETHPGANIILLDADFSNKYIKSKQVFPPDMIINEYWSFPPLIKIKSFLYALKLAAKIRSKKFKVFYYLAPIDKKSRLFRDLFFFIVLCGLWNVKGHLGNTYKSIVNYKKHPMLQKSESENLMARLRASGINFTDTDILHKDINISNEERLFANDWLARHGLSKHDYSKLIIIGIGGKWPSKKWPYLNFEVLGKRLIAEKGLIPVIYGGIEDHEMAESLIKSWGLGLNVAGKLNIRESIATMENFSFYVGNDSGTMHMAASAGIRCICIFSAQDLPGKWVPLGANHIVHRVKVKCEGCRLVVCNKNLECLTSITVDQVFNSCFL